MSLLFADVLYIALLLLFCFNNSQVLKATFLVVPTTDLLN